MEQRVRKSGVFLFLGFRVLAIWVELEELLDLEGCGERKLEGIRFAGVGSFGVGGHVGKLMVFMLLIVF